ncbi:Branched-chain amino acid transport ATP-binding protein LivF [Collimonas arenae]|uniref:Branched-chain amino acid transport ATP-binding protein LivF n=1 Tax=Collimonas arenae TaxID=279058 RepID=A0A0A1FCB1_9BURK|nr:ABC transporter ATP-binding protein [Collimonas arenae]AIY41410.1 Branched-chain amino acid transport ATP-binding protein LivF [Collimonas arenae]
MNALLEIRGLHAFYDQSHVLHGVDLEVRSGEIVSLLGRNGVGRSTMLKAIMGMLRSNGSVRLGGVELAGMKTFQVARQGMAYVPEERAIFPTLTVQQNLLLGQKESKPAALDEAWSLMPRLAERKHVAAGLLSGGEQQMLSLCRSLMGKPRLIMVDEPTEGLASEMVRAVAKHLLALRTQGLGVLLVEQKLSIALDISDRVLVMGHGRIVFAGTPAELRANPAVRQKWLEV